MEVPRGIVVPAAESSYERRTVSAHMHWLSKLGKSCLRPASYRGNGRNPHPTADVPVAIVLNEDCLNRNAENGYGESP